MARPKSKSPKPRSPRSGKPERPDKYVLYSKAVQAPDFEVDFFDRVFKKHRGRKPVLLREDFCGTAAVCCEWVQRKGPGKGPDRSPRRAIGVDLDPEPLQWARDNLLPKLKEPQRDRIELRLDDVRQRHHDHADVLAAQNFSFFCFKTRDELRRYFQAAHANLADDGLMVLDMMGGAECFKEDHADRTKKDGFTYIWEEKRFDPITHDCRFAIHFKLPGRKTWKNVFQYDWRFWTMPEVRELLIEAGFAQTIVYWEGTTSEGEGDGKFRPRQRAAADPAWIAYIVALK